MADHHVSNIYIKEIELELLLARSFVGRSAIKWSQLFDYGFWIDGCIQEKYLLWENESDNLANKVLLHQISVLNQNKSRIFRKNDKTWAHNCLSSVCQESCSAKCHQNVKFNKWIHFENVVCDKSSGSNSTLGEDYRKMQRKSQWISLQFNAKMPRIWQKFTFLGGMMCLHL